MPSPMSAWLQIPPRPSQAYAHGGGEIRDLVMVKFEDGGFERDRHRLDFSNTTQKAPLLGKGGWRFSAGVVRM